MNLTLKHIYRLALANNLTAKQAGAKYNVRWDSLHKVGAKHKLPKLISEYKLQQINSISALSTEELKNYIKTLKSAGQEGTLEHMFCIDELSKRKNNGPV